MTTKKLMALCMAGIAMAAGYVEAAEFKFTDQASDGNWTNVANWKGTDKRGEARVPGDADEAKIGIASITITNEVRVGYFKSGVNGASKVVIDGGSLLTVGTMDYNSSSYNTPASMTVQNGGSATFNSRFYVGTRNIPGGSVTIQDGSLRVANVYCHNTNYTGTEVLDTRTTLKTGGLLDVEGLVLSSGVMDVAGGTLIIRQNIPYELNQWIAAGRMIAMGGAEGWKIEASLDAANGCTVIIAVPTDPAQPKPKPLPVPERITPPAPIVPSTPAPAAPSPVLETFTVGMLNPVVLVSSLAS